MDCITVKQAAEKWGHTIRRVRQYLENGRIDGAERFGNHSWMIPKDAKRSAVAGYKSNRTDLTRK